MLKWEELLPIIWLIYFLINFILLDSIFLKLVLNFINSDI